MDIGTIGATTETATAQTSKTSRNDLVGKDEFFELLITQLSNQDPLNPMEDRDFITQLAQFSTLEGMNEMTAGFNELRGVSLLGRGVIASRESTDDYQADYVQGIVEGIAHSGDRIVLDVGGETVYLDSVESVFQTYHQDETVSEE